MPLLNEPLPKTWDDVLKKSVWQQYGKKTKWPLLPRDKQVLLKELKAACAQLGVDHTDLKTAT